MNRQRLHCRLRQNFEIMFEPCQFIQEGQKREGRKGSKTIQDVDHGSADISGLIVEEDPWLKELNEYFTADLCGQLRGIDAEVGDTAPKKGCRVDSALAEEVEVRVVDPSYPLSETLEAPQDLRLPEHLLCLESSIPSGMRRCSPSRLSDNVKTKPLEVQPADPRRYHHARNVMAINEKLSRASMNATSSPHVQVRREGLQKYLNLKCALKRMSEFSKTMARKRPNFKGFFSAMSSPSDRSWVSPSKGPRTSCLSTAGAPTSASRDVNRDIKFVEFANLSIEEKMRAYCGYFDSLEQEQKMYVCPPAAYFDILMKELR
jgi:hypothetical protein